MHIKVFSPIRQNIIIAFIFFLFPLENCLQSSQPRFPHHRGLSTWLLKNIAPDQKDAQDGNV